MHLKVNHNDVEINGRVDDLKEELKKKIKKFKKKVKEHFE
jgi:hypothetical protein